MSGTSEAAALAGELGARKAALAAAAERIAGLLAEGPPCDRARVEAGMHEIRRLVRETPPFLARIQRGQAEATRAAAEAMPGGRPAQAWYDLGSAAGLFRLSLNQWPRIEALVQAQIAGTRWKLVPAARAQEAALAGAADAAFRRLHRILNPLEQDAAAAEAGAYGDIGLPQSRFVALAHAAYRVGLAQERKTMDFLDVGCGMGLKLLTAAGFFDGVAGIELDPGYAERARDFLGAAALPKWTVVQGDARAFGSYGEFDVVYMFRPLEAQAAMAELEAHIVGGLAPGALVIGPYRGFEARHRALGLWPLAPGLYIAGETRAGAAKLRRRAEHVGLAVRPPTEALRTVWTPILDASQRRGFDLTRDGPLDHA